MRHIALGVWARCLLMIVCQVAGSARAEESDGMYTSRGAKLWVDSYSQVCCTTIVVLCSPSAPCLSASSAPMTQLAGLDAGTGRHVGLLPHER
jgi:hypothetical protein